MPASIDDLFILPPCTGEVDILHVDSDFLLINKPTRLLSVPGRHPQNHDSVVSRLQLEYPGAGIVHRLDFDTSGVMVVPLTKLALSHISKQFQARSVSKHYTAVVAGIMAQDEGVIDLPIVSADGPHYKVCAATGKPSITEYSVLARDEMAGTTRVWLHPITGRSHQLRLHLQAIGHPILGCEFYGGDWAKAATRLLLHATDLSFLHPRTAEPVFIESAPDF
ncbi:RluA family pseudouridine synthase [Cellvibrio sp. PSBB023]|uniref:RluA family pseudouridine synthase n=1 Tax=Cellvibrio sp. PSBB023 TaxID=1945512 RepID=UPI00098F39E2|nr:pseudouridine synthase [Cellvibrio sp. PSBB023]AQT60010.1 RNA pseudouridine synthase [Cellvibrio sp. PSBB023]